MSASPTFEQQRREADRRMICRPIDWPRWPKLPMKRKHPEHPHGFPQLGIMIAVEGYLTTVLLVDLFHKIDDDNIETIDKIVYDSVDALLDDGWTVD